MNKSVEYLQKFLSIIAFYTEDIFTQFNRQIQDTTVAGVLFLLFSGFVYLMLCAVASGFSEMHYPHKQVKTNYLLMPIRIIFWGIYSIAFYSVFRTVLTITQQNSEGLIYYLWHIFFAVIAFYGAAFAIPPRHSEPPL